MLCFTQKTLKNSNTIKQLFCSLQCLNNGIHPHTSRISVPVLQHRYFRTLKRRPIEVIKHGTDRFEESFDEYFERIQEQAKPLIEKKQETKQKKTTPNEEKDEDEKQYEMLKGLHFKLYHHAPAYIKQLMSKTKSASVRKENNVFIVEGWRLLAEALMAGFTPKAIFYSRSRLLAQIAPLMGKSEKEIAVILNMFPIFRTPYKTLQLWSTLSSSPGLVGVFHLNEVLDKRQLHQKISLPITVIVDQIRDPGNMGSVLRTLAAVGVSKVLFTKGCCDPFESKALRSGAGALFRMNFEVNIQWCAIGQHLHHQPTVYLADICKETLDANHFTNFGDTYFEENYEKILPVEEHNIKFDKKLTEKDKQSVVVENEHIENLVKESLNMEECVYEVDEKGNRTVVNPSYEDQELVEDFDNVKLPIECHWDTDYFHNTEEGSVVLVVGGETGLSGEAKMFCCVNQGIQIAVPMETGMDSLNSSVATGVIVYEMMKSYRSSVRNSRVTQADGEI